MDSRSDSEKGAAWAARAGCLHAGFSDRSVSALEFREALAKVGSAVSVISTDGPAGTAGLTCSAMCAVSDTPPMVAVCVHRNSAANAAITANGVLCVNCLQADQRDLSQMFAGVGRVAMRERFTHGRWDTLVTGAPVCADALVALDCEIIDVREFGTHSMFIARVVATAHAGPADPLLYHQRSYATTRSV
ncbi:MAG TPA: flavin reductase family protein [Xanthobacteraceae bacterium]|jgi:flavin reductase (NADH)/flavin reductase/chlorophenol-4-monooxygenase component 1|nr:flavin reductase family protein [Xanthobacteraceae bacterium]